MTYIKNEGSVNFAVEYAGVSESKNKVHLVGLFIFFH